MKKRTPLYRAAAAGHAEFVRLLLATPGVLVNKTNNMGDTPLFSAALNKHLECEQLIRSAGGDIVK